MKNLMIAAACLAALASPRPAAAYPDAGTPYTVDAGGVSLNLLRDSRDPLLWYYLPASFIVAGAPAQRPELFLLKTQLPAGDGKLEDAAALLAGLNLTLPPDVRQKAAAAVAALPVMEAKTDPRSVKFECVDIRDAKLTLLDRENGVLAEAAADPSVTRLLDPARLAFTAVARGAAAAKVGELLPAAEGLKVRVDYSYAAGPGPVFRNAAASGTAGFAAYKASDRDKAILTLPPGQPELVFLKLPQVHSDAGIASIAYTLQLLGGDGKPAGVPATSLLWKDGAWTDQKGTSLVMVPLPVKVFLAKGARPESIQLRTAADITIRNGAAARTEKTESQAPLFNGDLPLALPPAPFRILTVSGDYVDFRGMDGTYAVQVSAKCDKEQENFILKTNKDGTLKPPPVTVAFKDECRSLSLTVGYISGGGKKTQATLSPGTDERLVYLQNPE